MFLPSPTDPWTPATSTDVEAALVALDCLGSRATEAAGMHLDAFHVAMEGTTRHGLVRAVQRILQGALGHPFMPNPAELRMQHDAVMKPFHEAAEREEHKRRMVEDMAGLVPRVRTAGEQERFSAIYRQFRDHCANRDGVSDIEAVKAKYDPRLLAKVPDRSPFAFEGAH